MKKIKVDTFLKLLELFEDNDESLRGKSLQIKGTLKKSPVNFYISNEISPRNYLEFSMLSDIFEELNLKDSIIDEVMNLSQTYLISASPVTLDVENNSIKNKPQIDFVPICDSFKELIVNTPDKTGIVTSRKNLTVTVVDTKDIKDRLDFLKHENNYFKSL